MEPERNFVGLYPKPFLSTYRVPYTGFLATELNRILVKGSPYRLWWAEICLELTE